MPEAEASPCFHTDFPTPLGPVRAFSDGEAVTALRFEGRSRTGGKPDPPSLPVPDLPNLKKLADWLEIFFRGQDPGPPPPLNPAGTPFRKAIWKLLTEIPWGSWTSYAALANNYACSHGMARMAPRAVGGAVGANPLAILIPCHRVLGKDGSLGGFAYGPELKRALLELEGITVWKDKA
ncbi:MAG: methylated-DNA--[protein]-cysteine S-methyltransferase [Deltaproteobacteria bacterium]|jgi:methylated-DNA-[protein]-cysteine S-methyltransferase|nr:methylated-DNA--[protein]-cysteine S-methyltransferase [Deltaproteobacteria bacterium]